MRFPLCGPALAAGALLAAVSLTAPAIAKSDRANPPVGEDPWVADALATSADLICPERKSLFGQSVGNFLKSKDAFDLIWFPSSLDLSEVWKAINKDQAQKASETGRPQRN